jgi:hypothetical protein
MEEIIDANLRLEAANYGFELVSSPAEADVLLQGYAGVLKKEGFPFDSCMPFYSFDIVMPRPKHGRAARSRLSLRVPNDFPCIRLAVAKRILFELCDRLKELDARPKN